jgi:heme exporter protein B
MFALITLMVVGISSAGTNIPHRMHAGLLWLILLFSAMTGLARVFVRETEARTQDALRLTADPSALFFGKALFNGALLLALQGIIVPLYSLMTSLAIRDYVLFLTMQILGNLGLTVASTLLAALVAKAGGRSALFPVLALPILLPLIMAVIGGTYAALAPDPKVVQGVGWVPNPIEIQQTAWEAGGTYVRMAVAFIGMLGPASFLLFEFVWNED